MDTFQISNYHEGLSSVRALLAAMEAIYAALDAKLAAATDGDRCGTCGQCCDFDAFGHRLYITTPELVYFACRLDAALKPMTGGVCPYRTGGRCSVYPYRFAGCRIFQCKGDANIQSDLTEATLAQLKKMCTDHHLPYRYMDLKTALTP